jgi:site-specific recombinase XerD
MGNRKKPLYLLPKKADINSSVAANPKASSTVEYNPASVYLALLSPSSRPAVQHFLNVIAYQLSEGQYDAHSFAWGELRYPQTRAILGWLAENYKPVTANSMRAALKRVLTEAWRLGQIKTEDYMLAVDLPAIKRENHPHGERILSQNEITALIEVCQGDPTPAGVRDGAIVAVMAGAGLRSQEVIKLEFKDVDLAANTLTISTGKTRQCPLISRSELALQAWLQLRGTQPGPVFYPIKKGGEIIIRPMTQAFLVTMLKKRARQAGLNKFSPNDLCRTFICELLEAGVDITTVQKLAGHAQLTTTIKYARRREAAKPLALERLCLPYQWRGF